MLALNSRPAADSPLTVTGESIMRVWAPAPVKATVPMFVLRVGVEMGLSLLAVIAVVAVRLSVPAWAPLRETMARALASPPALAKTSEPRVSLAAELCRLNTAPP